MSTLGIVFGITRSLIELKVYTFLLLNSATKGSKGFRVYFDSQRENFTCLGLRHLWSIRERLEKVVEATLNPKT